MSLITPIDAGGGFPGSDIESLKGKKGSSLEQEKERLKRAAKEFESLFMYQMLKEMRKTVKDSALSENLPMSGSLGKDTFTDMFDVYLAKDMASGGKGSISDLLYNSLEKLVVSEFTDTDESVEIRPLDRGEDQPFLPKVNHLPLEQPGSRPVELTQPPTQIRRRPPTAPPETGEKPAEPVETDPIRRKYGKLIDEAAEAHKLDSALISAVIKTESNGDRKAVSPAGAKGLMQLTDGTAADLGVRRVFDARENILSGSKYLKKMIDRFGDLRTALAAYNAGPGAVSRHNGVPPYRETTDYVDKVMAAFEEYKAGLAADPPKGS